MGIGGWIWWAGVVVCKSFFVVYFWLGDEGYILDWFVDKVDVGDWNGLVYVLNVESIGGYLL